MAKPLIGPDGEVGPLDEAFFRRARRGRPAIPPADRKLRVNVMLDPDVAARLREVENASALVNSLLREKLGV